MSDQIVIREMQDVDRERWDAFVAECPGATFFHQSGWKQVIETSLGHRCHYLYAQRDDRLVGVLPLGHVKSLLFGRSLVSAPFCVYGGVAATDPAAVPALIAEAEALADKLGVDYLELRHRQPVRTDWTTKDLYVTFRKSIDADPEINMKSIPRKQRAMVRKGIQAGLVGEIDTGIDRFFSAYSQSVRNLGTPVFPKPFFAALKQAFGEDCEVLTITREGRLVASVMSFYFRDEVLPYYGGGTDEARSCKGNDFMYWDLMRRAGERGVKVFDYGRSKQGTGSYSFKKNWGFEPEPLFYECKPVRAAEIPEINPLNPKYRVFIETWKKLPLPVANFIGPMIARNLG